MGGGNWGKYNILGRAQCPKVLLLNCNYIKISVNCINTLWWKLKSICNSLSLLQPSWIRFLCIFNTLNNGSKHTCISDGSLLKKYTLFAFICIIWYCAILTPVLNIVIIKHLDNKILLWYKIDDMFCCHFLCIISSVACLSLDFLYHQWCQTDFFYFLSVCSRDSLFLFVNKVLFAVVAPMSTDQFYYWFIFLNKLSKLFIYNYYLKWFPLFSPIDAGTTAMKSTRPNLSFAVFGHDGNKGKTK